MHALIVFEIDIKSCDACCGAVTGITGTADVALFVELTASEQEKGFSRGRLLARINLLVGA